MQVSELNNIREFYNFLTPLIFKRAEVGVNKWVDPYCGPDWNKIFSPIEKEMWHAIREFGHAPLYPQYPVFNYFVDFANPVTMVAVECDGKEFHKDKQKDKQRDWDLVSKGWVVYRVPGSDCFITPSDEYYELEDDTTNEEELQKFYDKTLEGFMKAIGIIHYEYKSYFTNINELSIARRLLRRRRSI